MSIESQIKDHAIKAIKDLYGADIAEAQIQVQKTRKEFEGDHTLVVFPFLRMSKKSPEATANELGDYFTQNLDIVAGYNVIKGFLNLVINKNYWIEKFNAALLDKQYGLKQAEKDAETIVIEYSSPNTNKPLHLGHVRNNLLGYSVSKIVSANGKKVQKVNLVNDRGIHICKSMLAWQKFGNGETPESSGKKRR